MKAISLTCQGDVIAPLPRELSVKEDQLLLPDGVTIRHGDAFNATIISNFLVATKQIGEDEEVVLNFNLAFYDTVKSEPGNTQFTDAVVPGFRYLSDQDKQRLYVYADEAVRKQAVADGFTPNGREGGIKVVRSNKDDLVSVARHEQESGAVVFESTGVLLPFPVRSTVELPGDMHLRLTGGSEFIRHSCLPNLRLQLDGNVIRGVALRHIEEGEKLTYNYLSTEWEMTKVFNCSCNVYSCYGVIRGFKYLDHEQQEHLLPLCSQAVKEKYRAPLAVAASLNAIGSGTALVTASTGCIVAQQYIPAGTVLFAVDAPPAVEKDELVLGTVRLRHCCDATTVLLDGKLVTSRPLLTGDALTFNLNLLHYTLPEPFTCACGSPHCSRSTVQGFSALNDTEKSRLWVFAEYNVRADAIRDGYEVASASQLVSVRPNGSMGQATFAAMDICPGARVFHVGGLVLPFPTVYTIFLGEGKHLLFGDGAQCLAHSCKPNTRIVVDPKNGCLDCFATEDIPDGALISFNYLDTEWDMAEPFQCVCGEQNCFRTIKGFSHLPLSEQLLLWPDTTRAIKARFAQTRSTDSVLSALNTDLVDVAGPKGVLCASQDLPSGTVLFTCADRFRLSGNKAFFSDVSVAHSCTPSAAYMENRVVLVQAVCAGTAITLNFNQLQYTLEQPFHCHCEAENCVGEVAGFKALTVEQKDAALLCTLYEVRAAAIEDGYKNKSSCASVDVHANGSMGQATFAAKHIRKGTRFLKVNGLVLPFPTVYTILLEPGKHLLFAGGAQCLAHDCDPNVRIVVDPESRSLDCLALRDIEEGEVICFNYLTTEWDMAAPFRCVCGKEGCFGKIRGFKHLAHPDRQKLWSTTTPAIRTLAMTSTNWQRLASPMLHTNAQGCVCAARELHEGTPVLTAARLQVLAAAGAVVVDEVQLRHSATPTAAVVENNVVLVEPVYAGREITVDLCCLAYRLELPVTDATPASPTMAAPRAATGFAGLSADERAQRLMVTLPAVREEAVREGYTIPSTCKLVETRANEDITVGHELFAVENISAGSRFLHVKGLSIPFPTSYTIMLSAHRHLLLRDGAQCISHSCDPNIRLCIDAVGGSVECEALRDIAKGERIAFNYNATEWHIHTPFHCNCHAEKCVFDVRGYEFLSRAQRDALRDQVTPAVRDVASQYANVQLDSHRLKATAHGNVVTVRAAATGEVLMEVHALDVQPSQIAVGRHCFIPHSVEDANCVLVENRIVSGRPLAAGEPLAVNMNYFVYDMTELFPHAYSETCKGFKYMDETLRQKYLYLCEPPVRAQAMRDGWLVKSSQSALKIFPKGAMGQTAFASRDIAAGERLFHCTGLIVPFPTMYTICVGTHRHLLFGDAAECIAHSCDPNVQVVVHEDSGTFDFVSIKAIASGDLVTFNYNTTEWDMNSPFVCLCGSPLCAKTCQGFKHLNDADRQRLWPIASDVVKRLCTPSDKTAE